MVLAQSPTQQQRHTNSLPVLSVFFDTLSVSLSVSLSFDPGKDCSRTADEASPHAPKVISCGKPALLSGVGNDPIVADICHLDEAWRGANGPKDALIIAFTLSNSLISTMAISSCMTDPEETSLARGTRQAGNRANSQTAPYEL